MPGRSDMVHFGELKRMLRLVNDLRDLSDDPDARLRHAIQGLCALAGGYVGISAEIHGLRTGRISLGRAVDLGWADERARSTFFSYLRGGEPHSVDPSLPRLVRKERGTVGTFRREDLISDAEWYASPHVQEARRTAGVDAFIYTTFALSSDRAPTIAVHRPWGERPFSERERRLVDAFHSACTFLHARPEPLPAVARDLPPRLADTLRGLLRGRSEKQVAADLGISRHTVHDYVKVLYRHFGVQSRGELLALCLGQARRRTGDGPDV